MANCQENFYLPSASVIMTDDSGIPSDATITSKMKQQAREQILEFAQLFNKNGNKGRAIRTSKYAIKWI